VETDKQSFQNWQAEQAQYLNEPDDQPMTAPVQPLDGATLAAMIFLIVPPMPANGKLSAGQIRFAVRRFFVLCAVINPEIGAGGFTAMAHAITEAGIATTKACLSNVYTELAEVTGSTALGKSANARKSYAESAKRVWALRKPEKQTRSKSAQSASPA
jgi:hypothetical protein